MSEDQKFMHTPGPWSTDPEVEHESVLGPNGKMVADCAIFGFGKDAPTQERNQANARLISAAPELYDALLEARKAIASIPKDAFGIGGEGETHWYLVDELLHQIDMAIAKAEGKIREE